MVIQTDTYLKSEKGSPLVARKVDLSQKSDMIAENMTRKLFTQVDDIYEYALSVNDEIKELKAVAIDLTKKYNRLRELMENENAGDEEDGSIPTSMVEHIQATKNAMVEAQTDLKNKLEENNLLLWLHRSYKNSIVQNYCLVNGNNENSMKLDKDFDLTKYLPYHLGMSAVYGGAKTLYDNFGITTLRPSIIFKDRLADYLFLLEFFKNSKTASKKANKLISLFIDLMMTEQNMDNNRELHLLTRWSTNTNYTIPPVITNNTSVNPFKLEKYSTGRNYRIYGTDSIPVGCSPQTKSHLHKLINHLVDIKKKLNQETNRTEKTRILNRYNHESPSYYTIPLLFKDGFNIKNIGYTVSGKLTLLLIFFGYDNFYKFLTYIKNYEIDIHSFLDNITDGEFARLADELEQQEFFHFLKKLGNKSPTRIPGYIAFFGYKRVRNAKNTLEMDAQIALINQARRGFVSGKTGENELLLERMEGNQLIYFTKEEGEITTIGNRTGCCFTPSGLAKSLLKIARQSNLAGILEGRHGTGSKKADWFSFVWELVEYNEETQTLETALILDNIESMRRISTEDWAKIYKWLLKTPYNKIYLGTMRNDIDSHIFNSSADPTDLADWHINPTYAARSRQIIYYEKEFNSYSYDDSRNVYTVIDRTNRAPQNLAVARVTTMGEFNRVLYAEGLVWGSDSDYSVLRKLKFKQSPTYLTRDSLGNIYGYLITRLYKYNTETQTMIYDDNLIVDNDHPLASNEELILYFDDVYATRNMSSMKALNSMVEDILVYAQANNIRYVSANFNSYSEKFIKRIEAAGVTILPDTRFSSGTTSALQPKPSLLLQGHEGHLPVRSLNLDEPPHILFPELSDE